MLFVPYCSTQSVAVPTAVQDNVAEVAVKSLAAKFLGLAQEVPPASTISILIWFFTLATEVAVPGLEIL